MPRRNPGPRLKWRPERGQWEIQWFEEGRRRRQATGSDCPKHARRQLEQILSARRKHTGPRDPTERLIADLLADYVEDRGQKVRAAGTLKYSVANLLTFWGDMTAGQITSATCRGYADHRDNQRPGISTGTIRRELGVLSAAVMSDWRAGRLNRPVPVERPEDGPPRQRWLTRKEAADLLWELRRAALSRSHMGLFFVLALYTGARPGAILGLRWPHVDLVNRRIYLQGDAEASRTKRRPVIPIPARLAVHLRIAKRKAGATGYVIRFRGKPIKQIRRAFQEAAERASMSGVTPYTLRHTLATWLLHGGVDMDQAGRWLGHSDRKVTDRTYAHHDMAYLGDIAAAIDNKFRRANRS